MDIHEIRIPAQQVARPVQQKAAGGRSGVSPEAAEATAPEAAGIAGGGEVLNSAEKEFFAQLVPQARESVQTYSFYDRNRPATEGRKGAIVDRKG